jgi:hypothetical protein
MSCGRRLPPVAEPLRSGFDRLGANTARSPEAYAQSVSAFLEAVDGLKSVFVTRNP